jgi:predicted ATP-dependent serine protease
VSETLSEICQDDLSQHEIQNWNNLFNLKPANEWIADVEKRPLQKALFGDFWLEGELAILFSDTGRGKSTLAVQIAEALARGIRIEPMTEVPPAQKVLYFDFEMSEKQFAARYSAVTIEDRAKAEDAADESLREHYQFSDNFLRAQAAPHDELPSHYKTLTQFLQASFTELLRESGAKIVIVDNITFLKGANVNASAAAQLMKALKHIKQFYGISILVLAHTPKRPFTAPISINDLQGSNMLSNFADSIFALGASNQDRDLRYLKQVKQRGTDVKYDASNVMLFRRLKSGTFLHFEFAGYGSEREHLEWNYEDAEERRVKLKASAVQMNGLGKSQRQIALALAVSPATVNRFLKVS